MGGFLQVPVITEEVIKISTILGADRLIWAVGLLQTASQIMTAILGATIGFFYDDKNKTMVLCSGIIIGFCLMMS